MPKQKEINPKEVPVGLQELVAQHLNEIQMIALALLDRNPGQPESRTESGIEALARDILQTRLIVPIVAKKQGNRFVMIDGHRRKKASELLMLQDVPVQVIKSPLPPTLLWTSLNRSMKTIGSGHYFFCWAAEVAENRESVLNNVPAQTRKNIVSMVEIFGLAEAVKLADGKLTPHISKFIHDANRLIVSKQLDPLPLVQIGKWMIAHEGTGVVQRLRRDPNLRKPAIDKLRTAIMHNQPYERARKVRKPRRIKAA